MRQVPILSGVFLLLAGFMLGRATAIPAPFIAAQVTPPVVEVRANPFQQPISAAQSLSVPKSPRQVFRDDADKADRLSVASAAVAEAKPPAARLPTVTVDGPEFFGRSVEPSPAKTESVPTELFEIPASESQPKTAPAFIPTPIAAHTEQEEKYLNAALKVFRGIGENERLLAVEQMVATMEEQDAAAELLRLRTELQQLSEKYPKTGAAKKALEAIQTLPIISPPTPVDAAAPAAPTSLPASDDGFAPSDEAK